MNPKMFL